ncbi:MAG: hypothetical protein J5825_02785, partial [Lachnospiraceae bacterium]|nr:hypothetical protein [Lachnospiraceae bacterium]
MDRKREKSEYTIFTKKKVFWTILILWCLVTLVCVVRPDREYSSKEKRSLTTRESIAPSKLASGNLDQKVETYVTDQLPGRDSLISLRSSFLLLTGNRYSQGVILGKNGQMMEPFETPSEETTSGTIDAIRKIGEMSDAPSLVVVVPTAVGVCTDLHPAQLRTDDQKVWAESFGASLPEGVDFCDLTNELVALHQSGEQVYYRSDHHWRTESAFACLPTVAEALGIEGETRNSDSETPGLDNEDLVPDKETPDPGVVAAEGSKASWTRAVVCTDMHGSLAAASGYSCRGEDLAIYIPDQEIAYVVTDTQKSTKKGSLYDLEGLKGDDPYRVFLGGNSGELR